jgi:ribosomal protein S18 acetylase RimI-like enzyme
VDVFRLTGLEPNAIFEELARIHQSEIHEGNLSALGTKFLVTLYRALASSPHSFVFACRDDETVLGFICGSLDTRSVYRDFIRRAGISAFVVLLPRLFSLSRLRRIAETLFYPSAQEVDELPSSEILNFCVRSTHQGRHIGSRLFTTLCSEFQARGISCIRIVTGERQESARRFYERKGASYLRSIEVHKGVRSLIYIYKLPSLSPTEQTVF